MELINLNKKSDINSKPVCGLLSLTFQLLKNNMHNIKAIYELKTFFINFALSFMDKSFVKLLLSDDYSKDIVSSIINSLEEILFDYVTIRKNTKNIFF